MPDWRTERAHLRLDTVRARIIAVTAFVALCAVAPLPAESTTGPLPVARHVPAIPTVGPLFFSVLGLGPPLGLPHYCSAAVVHSAGHNLAITAAHCIYGTGIGIEFAPGYSGRESPLGVWAIRRVYLDPQWVQDRDPRYDVAVLLLRSRGGPWLAAGRLVGVTGGLHQGGCTPDTSYSAPFGSEVAALLARARVGAAGDVAPVPGGDAC